MSSKNWSTPLPLEIEESSKCVHPNVLKNYTVNLEKRQEAVEKFAYKFTNVENKKFIEDRLQRRQGFFQKKKVKRVEEAELNKKSLSISKKRQLGLYSLPRNTITYAEALPIHHLWLEYFIPLLPSTELKSDQEQRLKLFRAEYIGAMLEVTRSKCPSLVGLKGIIIFETKFTFKIVCENNQTKTVPKTSSAFCIIADKVCLTIFGKYFVVRSAERINKKLKTRMVFDL